MCFKYIYISLSSCIEARVEEHKSINHCWTIDRQMFLGVQKSGQLIIGWSNIGNESKNRQLWKGEPPSLNDRKHWLDDPQTVSGEMTRWPADWKRWQGGTKEVLVVDDSKLLAMTRSNNVYLLLLGDLRHISRGLLQCLWLGLQC